MQLHGIEPNRNPITLRMVRNGVIGGKHRQLGRPLRPLIESLDHAAPRLALAVVDLAEIQYLPLHHLAAGAALALDNVPIDVLLAILEPSIALQIHAHES